ncbi:MAG: precorrin-3B synthase [Proteobacteria bacterium]|nr:precorrin-3B synthase [Pseudomonadota bacterium]
MTTAAHLRKGWCPGALRPMRSGDGLLVRVRPHAGVFSLSALCCIGTVAARFGSGEIDLTNRGNFQIRGVSDDSFEGALAALDEVGLIDTSAEAEAVRNVVVDPLSGLDPRHADVRDLAAWLEDLLASDARLWSLPGKFGFSFSGLPAPGVGGRTTDIMLAASGDHFSVFIDGAAEVHSEVRRQEAVNAAHHLALTFVELKENDASFRRMRDAVSRFGAVTVFAMSGLRASHSPMRRGDHRSHLIGRLSQNEQTFAVGVGLPFGRITAVQIASLCDGAAGANVTRVHISPERALVFPVSDDATADTLLLGAERAGLIARPRDVRLAMDVCPGAPACRNASTETRRDAERLAATFSGGMNGYSLHVSGCEKGCARQADADITLVGRGGSYDIIRNGCASAVSAIAHVKPDEIGAVISRFIMEPAK